MKCGKCGFENLTAQHYCTNCGAKMELSPGKRVAELVKEKQSDRERAVFVTLGRWLAGALTALIVLFALKSALTMIPHEPVEAHFPPPRADITDSVKIPFVPARLPMPKPQDYGFGTSKETENKVIENLKDKALKRAERYRVGGPPGKVIHAFILKRYGDAVTVFCEEGVRIVPTSKLTPLTD